MLPLGAIALKMMLSKQILTVVKFSGFRPYFETKNAVT